MAVNVIRYNGELTLTGSLTWDTLATVSAQAALSESSFIIDVKIWAGQGLNILECGVVAWYQSQYYKDSGGVLNILGSIRTIKEYLGSSNSYSYRQTVSSSNILIEAREDITNLLLYYDISIRRT